MRVNGAVPAGQLLHELHVTPDWHAHDGEPSHPEVPTSVRKTQGDSCMSGALPVSSVVAWKRAERSRSCAITSGGCAGSTVDIGPFTVAGSLRARFDAMKSARSHGLGNPSCCSPTASLATPTGGAP